MGEKYSRVRPHIRMKSKKKATKDICAYCNGTGHEPGWVGRPCKVCHGKGKV